MFYIALSNVILTLLYIIPGFILSKKGKAKGEHLSTMSQILIFVCSPCMIINSFINMTFDAKTFINMCWFFIVTLFTMSSFLGIVYLFVRKNYHDARYRILSVGAILGNVGFFGIPITQALLPNYPEAVAYASIYVVSMNILLFTVGVYALTMDKKYISIKPGILNPSSLAFFFILPIYILGLGKYTPTMLLNAIALLGKMTTPMCMLILGIRLGTVDFAKLFKRPFIYIICLLKLIIYPTYCFLVVRFLPFDYAFKSAILILSSVPCASIILNMAEIHHSETEIAANAVLLSTLVCFLTIPVMILLV